MTTDDIFARVIAELPRFDELFELSNEQQERARALTPANVSEAWSLLAEASREEHPEQPAPDVPPDTHILERDAALAGFVCAHPGVLETLVLERFSELEADRPGTPDLRVFRAPPPDPLGVRSRNAMATNPLGRTLSAWTPEAGCALCARIWTTLGPETPFQTQISELDALHNLLTLAAFFVRQSATTAVIETMTEMAPESRNVVEWLATADPKAFSPLFDEHAWQLTGPEIETRILDYTGWSSAALHERLRGQSIHLLSRAGFLGADQNLGEVIAADLQSLRDLGLSHTELAERLEACATEGLNQYSYGPDEFDPNPGKIAEHQARLLKVLGLPEGSRLPWRAAYKGYRGHQQHPFHRCDVHSMIRLGAGDVSVHHIKRNTLYGFSDLLPELIARFAFFEGPGLFYRVEPLAAATAMDLS